jgi:hypothetical protein
MLLVAATMMFGVAANSIKYGLHANIIPQEGYEGTKNQCLWTGPKMIPLMIHVAGTTRAMIGRFVALK